MAGGVEKGTREFGGQRDVARVITKVAVTQVLTFVRRINSTLLTVDVFYLRKLDPMKVASAKRWFRFAVGPIDEYNVDVY